MKKILSGILAAAMVMSFASVAALAADTGEATGSIVPVKIWNDKDDEELSSDDAEGISLAGNKIEVTGRLTPGLTLFVPLTDGAITWTNTADGNVTNATTDEVKDGDLFKFAKDKDTNGNMIKNISLLTDKSVDGHRYDLVLKFEFADSTTTSEIHTDGEVSFTAKKDSKDVKDNANNGKIFWKGDSITIDYSFWMNNGKASNDDNPDSGDRVYFDPDDNDTNTLIWGDDRAALKFEADDDASKFYARLSTSTDRTLYAEYGDPVDADLWFYDFVTNPTIPSTSRATLTLGIPWDEDDDDYVPDPETCFIYEKDADGNLTDVTDKFTFSEDDEEIPGWSMKTRVLGTYVLSDTELDIEAINADDEDDDDAADDVTTPDGGKDIPQTGSSDMVNVAVVAAVVSLAAAGAVAFRKVK